MKKLFAGTLAVAMAFGVGFTAMSTMAPDEQQQIIYVEDPSTQQQIIYVQDASTQQQIIYVEDATTHQQIIYV